MTYSTFCRAIEFRAVHPHSSKLPENIIWFEAKDVLGSFESKWVSYFTKFLGMSILTLSNMSVARDETETETEADTETEILMFCKLSRLSVKAESAFEATHKS